MPCPFVSQMSPRDKDEDDEEGEDEQDSGDDMEVNQRKMPGGGISSIAIHKGKEASTPRAPPPSLVGKVSAGAGAATGERADGELAGAGPELSVDSSQGTIQPFRMKASALEVAAAKTAVRINAQNASAIQPAPSREPPAPAAASEESEESEEETEEEEEEDPLAKAEALELHRNLRWQLGMVVHDDQKAAGAMSNAVDRFKAVVTGAAPRPVGGRGRRAPPPPPSSGGASGGGAGLSSADWDERLEPIRKAADGVFDVRQKNAEEMERRLGRSG